MTPPYEHEAFLRAALHAAADSLEPRADGLDRIRARLRRPSPAVVRVRAAWIEIFMRAPTALQDACYWLASNTREAYLRLDRAITPGRHRSRTQSWLRPAVAMGVTLVIVAAGAYAAITASNLIFPSTSGSQSTSGNAPPGHTGGGQPGAPATHSSAPMRSNRPTPAASCAKSTAATTPAPAVSPTVSPTASPTPSPTASPTNSPSPNPTPSDTSTTSLFPGPSPTVTSSSSPNPSSSPLSSGPPVVPPTAPSPKASTTPCARSS